MSSPKKPKTRIETALAVFSLVAICVISLANVIVRYTTQASFAFTEEFSVFLMVVLTFAGGAMAARTNENIRISFLEHKVGPVGRRILYTLQWIISLIVLVAKIGRASCRERVSILVVGEMINEKESST